MKPILFKSIGRLGTKSPALLFSFVLALVPFVAGATQTLYTSPPVVPVPPSLFAPQVDATSFFNSGVWNISTVSSGAPYETSHTLNYTNQGMMTGSTGWEFDNGPLVNGGRGWSANFFNDNNGTIAATNGAVVTFLPNQYPGVGDYLLISATNIINKGALVADEFGEINLTGSEVSLARSALVIVPAYFGSANATSNYVPDTAIYDEYWSGGNSNVLLVTGSPWNGTTLPAFTAFNVGEPCATTGTIQIGPFNPQYADSYSNSVGPHLLITTNSSLNPNPAVIVYSNQIRQAVFVFVNTNTGITATNHFKPSLIPTNAFQTVVVQLDKISTNLITLTLQTNTIFILDDLASSTNRIIKPNIALYPAATCNAPTFRPSSVDVSRLDPLDGGVSAFANGFPGSGSPSATFFYNATFTNPAPKGIAETYSALVDNLAAEPPAGSGITNAPGRIHIIANDLDLTKTRMSAAAEIVVQASNLVSSAGAIMDCQNLSYNIGSTNGSLNFLNLAGQSVVRVHGTVNEWSGLWTNYIATTFQNFVTNSAGSNAVNSMELDITNVTEIDISITVVDASGLLSLVPVTVQDLNLNSTNIVVSDSMDVVNSMLFNGQSLTLVGNLTLSDLLQNWTYALAPTLRYFTNNGTLDIPDAAHFGDDGPTNYAAFVNNGNIFSAGQTINSDYLAINSGSDEAFDSDFLATCKTGLVSKARIIAGGDVQFWANNLQFTDSFVAAFNAINFTVTSSLSDSGIGDGSIFVCSNGFNLFIKPTTGDLLGTTVTNIALEEAEVDNVWAGQDFGAVATGYTNNVALGNLVLLPQGASALEPLFHFTGATSDNGMYVSNLDLSHLAGDFTNEIQIDPNLTIYFVTAEPPSGFTVAFVTNEFGGRLQWVPGVTSLGKQKVSGGMLSGGKFQVSDGYFFNSANNPNIPGDTNAVYTNIYWASTNLVNWTPVYTNIYTNISSTSVLFTDPVTNYPRRFYRRETLQ
jgi:hypothetical protein